MFAISWWIVMMNGSLVPLLTYFGLPLRSVAAADRPFEIEAEACQTLELMLQAVCTTDRDIVLTLPPKI